MPLACRVQWSLVDHTGDTVKQSQRRVTSPATVIQPCLLRTRSKMFRRLKYSLTAPRRTRRSSRFFIVVSFNSASCLRLGDLAQRCLGQPVDLPALWPSAVVIPRPPSTAVHFQSVERRVQRNLEGIRVGSREMWKICRRPSCTSSYQGRMYILIATESSRNPVKKAAKVWSGFAVTFSFRNVFFCTFLIIKVFESALLRLPCAPGKFEMSRQCREDDGDGGGTAICTKVPRESTDDNPTRRHTRSSLPALDLEYVFFVTQRKKRKASNSEARRHLPAVPWSLPERFCSALLEN